MNTQCETCQRTFNTESIIPFYFPECGHNVCMSCLRAAFVTSKRCPQCNTELELNNVNDYVPDIDLLNYMRAQYSLDCVNRLQTLQKSFLERKKSQKINLELFAKDLNTLSQINVNKADGKILMPVIDACIKEIGSLVINKKGKEKQKGKGKGRFNPDLSPFGPYGVSERSVMKVGFGADDGQRVFAYHFTPFGELFGELSVPSYSTRKKLSLTGPIVRASCLSVQRVTPDDLISPLDSLKKTAAKSSYITFLKLQRADGRKRGEVFIRLKERPVCERTLRFFIGEDRLSYKGCAFHFDCVSEVYTVEAPSTSHIFPPEGASGSESSPSVGTIPPIGPYGATSVPGSGSSAGTLVPSPADEFITFGGDGLTFLDYSLVSPSEDFGATSVPASGSSGTVLPPFAADTIYPGGVIPPPVAIPYSGGVSGPTSGDSAVIPPSERACGFTSVPDLAFGIMEPSVRSIPASGNLGTIPPSGSGNSGVIPPSGAFAGASSVPDAGSWSGYYPEVLDELEGALLPFSGRWFMEADADGVMFLKFHTNPPFIQGLLSERVYWMPPVLFSKSCSGVVTDCGFVYKLG